MKHDTSKHSKVKSILSSMFSTLSTVDSEEALKLCKWLSIECDYKRRHYNNERFPNLPKGLKRGDIVWVQFGTNIGDELSDDDKDGHFAVIWNQQGFVFNVIPLSSDKKYFNSCAVNLGILCGLPINGNSYAKIDMMRSIHIRRIRKISGISDGKIELGADGVDSIKSKLVEKFTS